MSENLDRKVGQATKWSSITEIVTKLISPLTNMILARLLTPDMFGVVATLTMVVSFAEIFTDAGFQKYLVQHEFRDEEDLNVSTNVAFWTNLAFSALLWGLIALFATPITRLVGSPGYETAVIVMCAQIPMLAFSSIQMARYRRDFNYRSLFFVRLCTALVPLVVTVPLALVMKSYWALVIGTLSRDLLNAVILTVRSRWKPGLVFRWAKLKEMLSFSVWTIVENITIWLTNYAGTFVVALYLTDHYLGLYKTTITTVNGYMNLITAATTSVLFSALSRAQKDEEAFRRVFFRFQRMVAMLVFPLGFGIFVFRDAATRILLGSQWMEAADFLGAWALTGAIVIIFNHYNSEVFRSKGRPRISVLVQLAHLAVLLPVLALVAQKDFQTIAMTRSVMRLEICIVSLLLLGRVFHIGLGSILRNVGPSLISSMVMAAAGFGLCCISSSFVMQLVWVAVCFVVYAACMLLLPAGRRQLLEFPGVGKILRRLPGMKGVKA